MALSRFQRLSARCRCWAWAALVLLIGAAGCASWKTHDEAFRENELSESVRKARPHTKDQDVKYGSFSEKGRQIERDLHAL